jgi:HEPN domain-containing protein
MSEADPPEPPGASATEAERWLSKASDDLAIARVVTSTPDVPRWPACFHAQQAAEKALKAHLVAAGIAFPFTHALDRLADLVEADGFE